MVIRYLDRVFISIARTFNMPFARIGLFIVFAWFGVLKVVGLSPANPLVGDLLNRTMPWIDFGQFVVLFGLFETLIGISFLVPRLVRVSILLLGLHMVTTFMPLVLLPQVVWQKPFVPTLEGQYIIKNLLIICTAISIVAHMHMPKRLKEAKTEKN